ncbi:hypothetical protein ACWEU6_17890 [Streptosporangium sandarakinum]|uniref:hypothetical protein n=1 Tax=Streptosporangium sandarakinum TaxID=1260955 RepID=UPI0036C37A38
MAENLPAHRPCPPWCRAEHTETGPKRVHTSTFGPFSGAGQIVIRYVQVDEGAVRRPPLARLAYRDAGQPRLMDVEPDDAADWSAIISGLDIRSFTEFAEVLGNIVRDLGSAG